MPSASLTISSDPLAASFAAWRARGHTALIPYVTAGYPTKQETLALLSALVDGGADIIELGVPFSDPVADGPTIQRSSQIALDQGVTLGWVLSILAEFRRTHDVPVVIFSYLNPLLSYGIENFVRAAVQAGALGVLVVDLPLDAEPRLEQTLEESALSLVRLLAPTTAAERGREILQRTQGFLYYVARLGVTGARADLRTTLQAEVNELRALGSVPIAVGFGISTADQASAVGRIADGVVVGSALIDRIEQSGIPAARAWLHELRLALNAH
ncbi:MAG: tryptophan synthase subunit alpha [Longimicrobiales bacterium]